jgi:hypothetical protein
VAQGTQAVYVRIDAQAVKDLVARILERVDVPPDQPQIIADVLVRADLRGIESHGVQRLNTYYLNRLRTGRINPRTEVTTVQRAPGLAVLDANNGMGQVAGVRAMTTPSLWLSTPTGAIASSGPTPSAWPPPPVRSTPSSWTWPPAWCPSAASKSSAAAGRRCPPLGSGRNGQTNGQPRPYPARRRAVPPGRTGRNVRV